MKNVKRMLVVALCGMMMSASVEAGTEAGTPTKEMRECKNNDCGTFQVGMYRVQNTMNMKLILYKEAGEVVTVRLKNQKGEVLHEEVLGKKTQKYARPFNFSDSQDGRYTLEISNGEEVVRKDIKLSTKDIVETPARTLVAVN
jgi:hypothetical protein